MIFKTTEATQCLESILSIKLGRLLKTGMFSMNWWSTKVY